jgi:DNA-binding beta-propeller fold protein YncE
MNSMLIRIAATLLTLALGATACASPPDDGVYHLSRTIRLGGDGPWDYLIADGPARRLYVTHFDKVVVLDMDSGRTVGTIRDLSGVHGVAIVPEAGRGYASNGKTDSISIFDLKTLLVTGRIAAGRNPDAIIYEPISRRVFAFNHSGGDVTVINTADGNPAATIEVGGELEYAVSDDRGSIFVNVEDKSEIARIDIEALEVVSRWPLAPCEEPTGIAMDKQTRRLFSSCANAMLIVVDADDGHIVAQVAIGRGSDGVRFDAATGLIFTSNGEGNLSIIHEDGADDYHLLDTVVTQRGARTLEIDPTTHNIYTATAELGPTPEAKEGERRRPKILPDTFVVLEFSP